MKEFWKENRCFFLVFLLVLVLNLVFPKYFIRTGSMEPALQTGAIVWINPYREPEVGEIAAYRNGSVTVVHRVTGKIDHGFVFKGDANREVDGRLVQREEILGTVILKLNLTAPLIRRILHE